MNTVMLNKKPDESNYAKVFHDVFISYSRRDKEFVLKLRDALIASNHSVWLDSRDIPYTADWQEEIYRNIVTANNVLCVLSPDFIQSQHCRDEVAYAVTAGKRLVPIEIRDINRQELSGHQELAPLNKIQSIPFQGNKDFDLTFKKLVEALDTDLDYIQNQRQWGMRALEWENKGRNNSYVLRGRALEEAEHWRDNALVVKKEPAPTPLQIQYIALSRRVARSRQRYVISLGGAIAVAIVVALVVVLVLQNALLRSLPVSVTNLNDAGPGSLREAINNAHPGEAITFQKTLKGTITLTSGELPIKTNVEISGPGQSVLAISGGGKSRVFEIEDNVNVTIANLTIKDGSLTCQSRDAECSGGGILNKGSLLLINTTVTGSQAEDGGGILNYANANLTLIGSTISDNNAGTGGGGIFSANMVTITNSTISDNKAKKGGGIDNIQLLTVINSTISDNRADAGGGIYNSYGLDIENSTISGNTANEGGGLVSSGVKSPSDVLMIYCTVYNNTAGGIINDPADQRNIVHIEASIVAGNNRPGSGSFSDLYGTFDIGTKLSFGPQKSLIEHIDGATFTSPAIAASLLITGVSPNLGPLQNNGGPTQTHALLPGSSAIDAIPYSTETSQLCGVVQKQSGSYTTDQRGVKRPQGRGCDLGAYEYQLGT